MTIALVFLFTLDILISIVACCTLVVCVFAGNLPLATYVSHEGYKHTTKPVWQATKRAMVCHSPLYAAVVKDPCAMKKKEPPSLALNHLFVAAATTAMLNRTHTLSLSLSPSSIRTHTYTHVSTQGRRRWSWSKSTSL